MEFKNVRQNNENLNPSENRIQTDMNSRQSTPTIRDLNHEFSEKFKQKLDEWQPDENLWLETQGEFVSGQIPYRRLHAKSETKK